MHHFALALLHTIQKSRQHSLCGAREGRNPFAARRPMPGQCLKAVIASLTSLRLADLAAVTCWKLDGTFRAAVSPPKVKALQAQGECVRSYWISCRFYSAERLQNVPMHEGCVLHSGQSAASITPGGRWRGLPHPDHASRESFLILNLKFSESS